jgi:Ni,Fe-hydrogenase I cytochrome b subunit
MEALLKILFIIILMIVGYYILYNHLTPKDFLGKIYIFVFNLMLALGWIRLVLEYF